MATVIRVTMEIADGEDPYIVDGVNTWDYKESPSDKDNPEPKASTAPKGLWGETDKRTKQIYDPYA